ncbi:MAG: NAD-dependent epimerase/dehydratase family protein [Candidatus Hydrogenedentes bacterium]|nr:NAD-dependent epimerase/dehydratase family protein [Candidatus Hydrogenedentota bacterium]
MGVKRAYSNVRVVALDNLKRRGSELNLVRLRGAGVEFVHGDVRSMEDLESLGAVDLILECSAEPSVLAGYTSAPDYLVNTNLLGAVNCFELARRHGAATIFLSTSRVYPAAAINSLAVDETETRFVLRAEQSLPGVSVRGISEQFPLDGTRSLYGATKLCGELLLREYLEMYGLKGIINRCGVITGPWQMGKIDQGVVVLWVARHMYGKPLKYIGYGGRGKQVRDMLHVDDLLKLVLYQIDHLDSLTGQTFNVGGGLEVSASLCELTALCRETTGAEVPIGAETETRPADIRIYLTDYTRVTELTGWRPEKNVPAIVQDIAAWIAGHRDALEAVLA